MDAYATHDCHDSAKVSTTRHYVGFMAMVMNPHTLFGQPLYAVAIQAQPVVDIDLFADNSQIPMNLRFFLLTLHVHNS